MKLIKLKYTDDRTPYVNPENIAYVMEIKSTNTSYIQFIDEGECLLFKYPASDLLRLLEKAGIEIIGDAKGE